LGAVTFDAAIIPDLAQLTPGTTLWKAMFLWAPLIPASLLGCILGMFFFWPWARRICSRYNAGGLKVGDQVMILSGPLKGTVTDVDEITVGQGGWNLAVLDLGPADRNPFEMYSLLKQ